MLFVFQSNCKSDVNVEAKWMDKSLVFNGVPLEQYVNNSKNPQFQKLKKSFGVVVSSVTCFLTLIPNLL